MKKFLIKYVTIVLLIVIIFTLVTLSFNLISMSNTLMNIVGVAILSLVVGVVIYKVTIWFSKNKK